MLWAVCGEKVLLGGGMELHSARCWRWQGGCCGATGGALVRWMGRGGVLVEAVVVLGVGAGRAGVVARAEGAARWGEERRESIPVARELFRTTQYIKL